MQRAWELPTPHAAGGDDSTGDGMLILAELRFQTPGPREAGIATDSWVREMLRPRLNWGS